MGKEDSSQLLQQDMFSGDLVDTRTRAQKRAARQRQQPRQQLMFSQRDIAQIGVNPQPLVPLSPHTRLVLSSEDPRTEEEIERDRQRAAERLTEAMFPTTADETPKRSTVEILQEPDVDYRLVTAWLTKTELLYCRPDLEAQINALSEDEMRAIVERLGAALEETYWRELHQVLGGNSGYIDRQAGQNEGAKSREAHEAGGIEGLHAVFRIEARDLRHCGLSDDKIARLDAVDMELVVARLEAALIERGFWDDLKYFVKQALDDKPA